MAVTAGYDAGGAHLKVARVEDGRLTGVHQIACRLWLGLDKLDESLATARELTDGAHVHAVTMTGELAEIFASREEGASTLISQFTAKVSPGVRIFMGLNGFKTAKEALCDPQAAGSANFLATAQVIAAQRPQALLIDMGSTTTDIILCNRPQGLSDAERLQTGELVYTGFTRTPVASVTTRCPLLGSWQTLARDPFATMADVRRVLDELPEDIDDHATSDGRGKSRKESLVRLARGFGRDGEMRHLAGWQAAAAYIRECQLRSIHDGAMQVLSRPGTASSGGAVVAGIGASAAAVVAGRLGLSATTFAEVIGTSPPLATAATHHATAVAVALLASQSG